jgi:hypothetical protein
MVILNTTLCHHLQNYPLSNNIAALLLFHCFDYTPDKCCWYAVNKIIRSSNTLITFATTDGFVYCRM